MSIPFVRCSCSSVPRGLYRNHLDVELHVVATATPSTGVPTLGGDIAIAEQRDELFGTTTLVHGGYLLDSDYGKRDAWNSTGGRCTSVMVHTNPEQTPEKYRDELDTRRPPGDGPAPGGPGSPTWAPPSPARRVGSAAGPGVREGSPGAAPGHHPQPIPLSAQK